MCCGGTLASQAGRVGSIPTTLTMVCIRIPIFWDANAQYFSYPSEVFWLHSGLPNRWSGFDSRHLVHFARRRWAGLRSAIYGPATTPWGDSTTAVRSPSRGDEIPVRIWGDPLQLIACLSRTLPEAPLSPFRFWGGQGRISHDLDQDAQCTPVCISTPTSLLVQGRRCLCAHPDDVGTAESLISVGMTTFAACWSHCRKAYLIFA